MRCGVARLSSKKRFRLATHNASLMRDFYCATHAVPNAVEDLLSDIDGDAAVLATHPILSKYPGECRQTSLDLDRGGNLATVSNWQ